jgi:hypothetical protein
MGTALQSGFWKANPGTFMCQGWQVQTLKPGPHPPRRTGDRDVRLSSRRVLAWFIRLDLRVFKQTNLPAASRRKARFDENRIGRFCFWAGTNLVQLLRLSASVGASAGSLVWSTVQKLVQFRGAIFLLLSLLLLLPTFRFLEPNPMRTVAAFR